MKPGPSERIKTVAAAACVLGVVAAFWAPVLADRAIVVERDGLSSILPLRAFLARSVAAGDWPAWNPNAVLGKPFLAEWQSALFYPPSALLLVPPLSRGFNWFFAFHFLWTSLGAVLWLRRVGLGPWPTAAGALVWTLGGPLVSLGSLLNHLVAASWLPWVLLAWESAGGLERRVVASAAVLALALLTGSPEMALLCAGALVLASRRPAALLVPALAAGLAALQILPVWRYLGETSRGTAGLSPERVLEHSASFAQLLGLAAPIDPPEAAPFLESVYDGPLAVLLAGVALVAAPRRLRLALALAALALVALALGHRTPLLPALVEAAPLAALLRYPQKLLVGVHALVAAGAAFGAARVIARARGRARRVVGPILAGAIALDLTAAHRGRLTTLTPEEALTPPPIAAAILAEPPPGPPGAAPRYYTDAAGGPVATSPEEAVRLDRAVLFSGTGELYGLANVNRPDSLNVAAHDALHRRLGEVDRERALSALAALGTGWVTGWRRFAGSAIATPVALPADGDGGAVLHRLAGVQPRAFFASRIEAAATAAEALGRFLAAPPGGHAGLAVIESEGAAAVRGGDGEVRWLRFANDELALAAASAAGGLLVVNDSFLAGWTASIDGKAAPILRVNGLVRGVVVPAGSHRVEMRYVPPGLLAGAIVSAATAIALAIAWRTRRPGSSRAPARPSAAVRSSASGNRPA